MFNIINMRLQCLYLLIILYRVYSHQNVSESCSILQFFTCLFTAIFRCSWTQYQANTRQLMLHRVRVSVLQVVAAFNSARFYMSRMSLDDSVTLHMRFMQFIHYNYVLTP